MIHIIADTESHFINDSQSTEHNRIASDFITHKIQQFTAEKETALHVSLAGGRKTMSYYAGYALSLYGRWQDRLSHVLVNYPFMNNKDFFYPRPKAERFAANNRYYSTDEAKIILSDIPYVRMRYQVPVALLEGTAGFNETVLKIQQFNEAPSIALITSKRIAECNGVNIKLSPIDFAFYCWMCERKQQALPPLVLDADDFMGDFLLVYARFINPNSGTYEKVRKTADEKSVSEQKKWFEMRKSKLQRQIKTVLGDSLALPFLIQTHDYQQKAAYGLDINAKRITIIVSPK